MTKLKRHYQRVAELGCIVCKNMGYPDTPAQIHHPWGRKHGCEFMVLPLCFQHHQSGVKNERFVSRHPYKKEFIKRYGTEESLLTQVEALL